MKVSDKKNENQSLMTQALDKLRMMLITLELAPGEVLSENQLVKTLGIGRTPVREALQQLARDGLITIMPRRGMVVTDLNVQNQLKILEVRREIERYMAGSAAKRATIVEREQFVEMAKQLHVTQAQILRLAPAEILETAVEFHKLLQTAARNPYASAAMQSIVGLTQRFWYAFQQKVVEANNSNVGKEAARISIQHYITLCKAIVDGDEAAAREASDAHLENVEKVVRMALDMDLN